MNRAGNRRRRRGCQGDLISIEYCRGPPEYQACILTTVIYIYRAPLLQRWHQFCQFFRPIESKTQSIFVTNTQYATNKQTREAGKQPIYTGFTDLQHVCRSYMLPESYFQQVWILKSEKVFSDLMEEATMVAAARRNGVASPRSILLPQASLATRTYILKTKDHPPPQPHLSPTQAPPISHALSSYLSSDFALSARSFLLHWIKASKVYLSFMILIFQM